MGEASIIELDWDENEITKPGVGTPPERDGQCCNPRSIYTDTGLAKRDQEVSDKVNVSSQIAPPAKKLEEIEDEDELAFAWWAEGGGRDLAAAYAAQKEKEKEDDEDDPKNTPTYPTHGYSGPYGYVPPVVKPAENCDKIFVYCPLRRGGALNRIMERDGFLYSAKTMAEWRLINMGEFPALRETYNYQYLNNPPAGKRYAIQGDVYNAVPRTIKYLDSVMDCPQTFERKIISLEDGTRVFAYVIHSYKTPNKEEDIECGDWLFWKRDDRKREKIRKEERRLEKEREEIRRAEQKRLDAERDARWRSDYEARIAQNKSAPTYQERNHEFLENYRAKQEAAKSSFIDGAKVGKDSSLSQKPSHVSKISDGSLREYLNDRGINTITMNNNDVRVECILRFGDWYTVSA